MWCIKSNQVKSSRVECRASQLTSLADVLQVQIIRNPKSNNTTSEVCVCVGVGVCMTVCARGCGCVSVPVCAKVCATTTSKRNKFSTCELLFLILSPLLNVCVCVCACLCVCMACVINFWHLNWTPSTSKVLNQFDKFAFFCLQENQKQNNKNGQTAHSTR